MEIMRGDEIAAHPEYHLTEFVSRKDHERAMKEQHDSHPHTHPDGETLAEAMGVEQNGATSKPYPGAITPAHHTATCGGRELRMMAKIEALKAEREGMVWENVSRQHRGLAIAYDDEAFNVLAEQFNKVFDTAKTGKEEM